MRDLHLPIAVAGLLLLAPAASAQTRDVIPATGGNITIIPVYHGSLQVVHANQVIDVDPAAPANFTGLEAPTVILVTDIHDDHLDAGLVGRLRTPTTAIVAPAAAAGQLRGSTVMANPTIITPDKTVAAISPISTERKNCTLAITTSQ